MMSIRAALQLACAASLLLLAAQASAFEGRDYTPGLHYQSEWQCSGQWKFNWYCAEEMRKENTETPKEAGAQAAPEEIALKELERIRKDLDAKRALAIINPTPENIKAYMAAQQVEIERAAYFADVWRRVLWQNAALNLELKNPMNNSAILVKNSERDKAETATMTELAKEWGMFFFFKGDCPYCKHMVPTLQWLAKTYDMTILPVSVDGTQIEGLPPSVRDNGIVQKMGIEVVPSYVLGNIKTGKTVVIGSGVLSVKDFVERIYVLTQTKPGDL